MVINSTAVARVAEDISGIVLPDSVVNKDSYGIAESIKNIRSNEMVGFPLLEQTISRFEGYLDDNIPESVLVKPYLRGIAPFTWNQTVKESYIEVNTELKKNPVASNIPVVATQLAASNSELREDVAESSQAIGNEQDEVPLLAEFKLSPNAKLEFMPTTEKYRLVDSNMDGLISHTEIEKTLNAIVDGSSLMLVDEFNEMVALFTDFTENTNPIDFGGTKAAYVDGKLTIFKPRNTELKQDTRQLLAKKYRDADFNGDGELTPDEVQKLIALFMEGKTDYPSERIYELIDLYFQ